MTINFHPQREKTQVETWRNFLRVQQKVAAMDSNVSVLSDYLASIASTLADAGIIDEETGDFAPVFSLDGAIIDGGTP